MKDIRLAAGFFSHAGGAMPMNSNGLSWNMDFVTTTGNVIIDLLHNFHLECGARLHKLRVYETLTDPTGREVCGYLLVRGGVHAHAYALALKSTYGRRHRKDAANAEHQSRQDPGILQSISRKARIVGSTASVPDDYQEMAGIWAEGSALPADPPGELEVVDGPPDGGKIPELEGSPSAFTPDYAPEEMFEIAKKLSQFTKSCCILRPRQNCDSCGCGRWRAVWIA